MTSLDPAPSSPADDTGLVEVVERLRSEAEGLRTALRSRAPIEQAKGMLMERYGCTADEAFSRLATLSQHANVKLADVAAALVDATGDGPGRAAGRPPTPGAGPGAVAVTDGAPRTAPIRAGDRRRAGPSGPAAGPTPQDVDRAAWRHVAERWPRQVSGESDFGARVRARARPTRARHELAQASHLHELLDSLVHTGLADTPPDRAALAVVDEAGVLHLAAVHAVPDDVTARWRRAPLDMPVASARAVTQRRALWRQADGVDDVAPGDGAVREAGRAPGAVRSGSSPAAGVVGRVPLGLGLDGPWESAAVLPLLLGDRALGVVALTWSQRTALDTARRRRLLALVQEVAEGAARLIDAPNDEPDPAWTLLGGGFDPVLVAGPVHDARGRVVDLRVLHANGPARRSLAGGADPRGRTMLELHPALAAHPLLEACARVVTHGEPVDLYPFSWPGAPDGPSAGPAGTARIIRYRADVLLTWTRDAAPGAPDAEDHHAR